jgi:hypothetical protein
MDESVLKNARMIFDGRGLFKKGVDSGLRVMYL